MPFQDRRCRLSPGGNPGESRHSGLSPGVFRSFPWGKPVFQIPGIISFGRPGFWWVGSTWISPGETPGCHQGKVGFYAPLVFPWGRAAAPLFPRGFPRAGAMLRIEAITGTSTTGGGGGHDTYLDPTPTLYWGSQKVKSVCEFILLPERI